MRGFRSTLVLLVIFLSLLGYIYFVESKKPPDTGTETKPKAFSVAADKIEELKVKAASGDTAALKKVNGTWQLVEPLAVSADESIVSSIVSNLSSLEVQRVVEENPSSLKEYGLASPRVDVAFKVSGDKDFKHLLIGDKTATGSDLYARLDTEKRVVLISGYLDGTFDRTPFDLREKSILKFDRDKVDKVAIATRDQTVELVKSGSDWRVVKPAQARGDYGTIEGIITRLQSTQMKSIVAPEAADFKQYGLNPAETTVALSAGSSSASIAFGKRESGSSYARDLSRPMVFTVEESLATDLAKGAGEYRRKDIFEFRAFNATRVEIARAGSTVAFEKVKGAGKDAKDTWRRVAPTPAADVDQSKVDTLLTRLANLRAQSFADPKTQTGLNSPIATVTVRFEENKNEERLTFGRAGSDVYAARADEPGAAKLDAKEYDDAMKALDDVR